MNKDFKVFQEESAALISSFSQAIGKVAKINAPNKAVVKRALEASLANALTSLSDSLAVSVGTVGSGSFAINVKKLRNRLKSQTGLLVKASDIK